MNIIERQVKLGQELFQINADVVKSLTEVTVEGLQQVWQTNQDFARRLPEVRDPASFFELQREYGETVWSGFAERMRTRGELLKKATTDAGSAVRTAWERNEEAAVAAAEA